MKSLLKSILINNDAIISIGDVIYIIDSSYYKVLDITEEGLIVSWSDDPYSFDKNQISTGTIFMTHLMDYDIKKHSATIATEK